ncbi:hypothetical protein [Roseobacter weihaiensis]|uniref:hypothetical protein n=1 Tax=Roseobacter weihaiensis TaxID=2763262 RepID=UPI001D0AC099|nr:hypothetical protein [Roseobacter sp. H9]
MAEAAKKPHVDDASKHLVSELKELRSQSTEVFLEILSVLDGVRTSATDLSAQINAVADACRATTRVNEVSGMIDKQIKELRDILQQTHQDIDAKQVKQDLLNLIAQLPIILQNSGTFRYVGTLTQTTAATQRMDNMTSHADLLEEIAEKLKAGSQRAGAQIKTAVSAVEAVDASVSAAFEVITDLGDNVEANTQDKTEAQNIRRAYQDTISLTETLVAGNRRDLGALIGLMQFSDAFAQRLEHVWVMLEEPETSQFGGTQIAKAQLAAMITDAQEVRAAVTDALNRFVATCDSALNDLSAGLSGETKTEILAQMDKLQSAERLGGSIAKTMRTSEQQITGASKSMTAVGEGLDEFRELVALMTGSSYNVAIRASNFGDRQNPFAFLAKIVADCSAETGRTILKMSETLDGQREKLQEKVFADLKLGIDEFTTALEECKAIHVQVSAVDHHLETASEAAQSLTADIASALDILVRMTPIEQALEDILVRLNTNEVQEPRDEVCHAIYAIYTMERERDIHAESFSVPAEESGQAGALDDDDFEEF